MDSSSNEDIFVESTPDHQSRRKVHIAITLLVISFIIFLCQLLNLNPFTVKASGLDSLPISIRATYQADYSSDLHPGNIPAISENILIQLITDIPSTDSSIDRAGTLSAALKSPVPSMTPNNRLTKISQTQVIPTVVPSISTSIDTSTGTNTSTFTASSNTPVASQTPSATKTTLPTKTNTQNSIVIRTRTSTSTRTSTHKATAVHTRTPTFTPKATKTFTFTPTPTDTRTSTPTRTNTSTSTPTPTDTPISTPTVTNTSSPSPTPGAYLPVCYAGIPEGFLPSDDTYIRDDSPTSNFGNNTTFDVRPDDGADRRGLVRFDLSSIPSNAEITNAMLYLSEKSSKIEQITYLYRVTSEWDESTITWQSWISPGGDFDSGVSYISFVPYKDNCMLSLDITELVQLWVNGTYPNYGFILYSIGESHTISYSSKENGNVGERPKLDIIYTVP